MKRHVLTQSEVDATESLLGQLAGRFGSAEDEAFIREASVIAGDLPRGVRRFLNEFRSLEDTNSPACIIAGYPVDDVAIGPTPLAWQPQPDPATLGEQMLLVLYASQLGDLFAWSTQQHGRVVHDLFPIAGDGRKQLGSGSDGLLWWHTEDAFHPHRCDYLGLFCLRNSNQVATTIGSNSAVASIDPRFVQILFESRFTILPDESHLEAQPPAVPGLGGDGSSDAALRRAYAKMQALNAKPPAVAALFGDPAAPYLRVDPFFMKALDDEAARALDALTRAIDEHLCDLVVQPGEACFIDNFRAVHGRRPFKANYDGTDRWLKRVNITRDVRKSRDCRLSSDARVVY